MFRAARVFPKNFYSVRLAGKSLRCKKAILRAQIAPSSGRFTRRHPIKERNAKYNANRDETKKTEENYTKHQKF